MFVFSSLKFVFVHVVKSCFFACTADFRSGYYKRDVDSESAVHMKRLEPELHFLIIRASCTETSETHFLFSLSRIKNYFARKNLSGDLRQCTNTGGISVSGFDRKRTSS